MEMFHSIYSIYRPEKQSQKCWIFWKVIFKINLNLITKILLGLIFEPEQKEVLQSALNAGFDVAELCRSIFKRFKAKYTIDGRKSEQEMSKSAAELLRAWKWLIYCGPETIWDAIIEANYLMRKLFCK